jgi:predicted permease
MESLRQDLYHAMRIFARRPALTLVAIATLAIGIGASTAIFSVLYVTLLRPLPYPNAKRLCVVWTVLGQEGRAPASGPELLSLADKNKLFEQVGGIWVQTGALTGKSEPIQITRGWVTSNFLSMLTPRLEFGRLFLPEEQGSGRAHVVILSYELWKTRYGSDSAILGHAVLLNGQPYTVVGILPAGFKLIFPDGAAVPPQVDVYSPFQADLAGQPRDQEYIRTIATLRRGISAQSAQSELNSFAAQLRSGFHEYSEQDLHLQIIPLQQDATDAIRAPLLALFAGSGILLLIVCSNLAILLLTRANERLTEISLRAALGAQPGRITRQMFTESILLSCVGGCAGVVFSFGILRILLILQPSGIARNTSIAVSLPALCFAVLVSVGCGILFGLSPALMAREANLAQLLRQNTRSSTEAKHNFRQFLIGGEVALTFVLLTCSILLVRTFLDVLHVNPGFDARNVLTFRISLLGEHYNSAEVDRQFLIELERRLGALPGVLHAGFVSHLPFDDALPNWYDYAWRKDARSYEQNTLMADHRAASAGFFESLGAQFISGRNFDTSDETSRRKVAIIDDVLARQLWPGQSALGKAINVETQHDGDSARDVAEVIGVVKHLDFHSLTLPERGQVYLPYRMAARANMYFVLRAESSPLYLIPLVRQQLAGLDKELPVAAANPMDDYVLEARTQSRFVAVLFGSLAGIALLLSCLGIYGITANSVAQRTREIGIRMALGASPARIVALAFATSIRPIGAGAIAGVGLSFGFTPLLSGLLFGVRPVSTPILVGVFLFLSLVGLMAIMIPTARVLRGNPMSALRYE